MKKKGPVAIIYLFDGNKYIVSIEKNKLTSIYKNRSSPGLMNIEAYQDVESMIKAYREDRIWILILWRNFMKHGIL